MAFTDSIFRPGFSVKVTCSVSNAVKAIGGGNTLVAYNADAAIAVIIALGNASTVAVQPTTTPQENAHVLAPGSTQPFSISEDQTHIAFMSESGNPVLHLTRGKGV